ncbi:MAG TPA: type II toxin-antitoxin system VapC family toxin [Thermoleophilaceae bacterium]|nr:type II toxin-antitoxin system VapC family toxin [Thermoleophilaceae bacterium]
MAGVYLDTSALGRVLLEEPESDAIMSLLARYDERVSSRLLAVELHRLALREGRLLQSSQLLGGLALVPIDEAILGAAESIEPPSVATLDAIHLVTALRLLAAGGVEAIMTFDRRLAEGANEHGLRVVVPSA